MRHIVFILLIIFNLLASSVFAKDCTDEVIAYLTKEYTGELKLVGSKYDQIFITTFDPTTLRISSMPGRTPGQREFTASFKIKIREFNGFNGDWQYREKEIYTGMIVTSRSCKIIPMYEQTRPITELKTD